MSQKFIYCEKATKFCESFPLLLSYVVPVKINWKISQNVVAFSEYMNFTPVHPSFLIPKQISRYPRKPASPVMGPFEPALAGEIGGFISDQLGTVKLRP